MNTELPIYAAVASTFANLCGRDKPITYQELAALSGVAAARVYAYANGEHLGSAVALVQLCRQVPEAAAQLQALIDRGAQQSHGDEFELLSELGKATGEVAAHAAKGRFCHRARAAAINVARRMKVRCGLYLAWHAQQRAAS